VSAHGVQTDLTNVEDWDNERVNEIIRLVGLHARFAELKKFHRPISLTTAKFPACYVQPRTFDPTLDSIGLYNNVGEVTIYVYHSGNAADRVGEDMEATVAVLNKLFSRNALNDMATPAPTGKYFANAPYWAMSKFGPVQKSEIVGFQKDNQQLFAVQARISFRYMDYVLP